MYLDLSRGMKVNEFADLTTSEFVSEYLEENPNFVWSGRKHLETREYINESVAFSQVMKVPPCFFVVCTLESELNCRSSCVVIHHSQSPTHLSHLHWIETQGPGL